MPILSVHHLHKNFRRITAVCNLTFDVKPNEIYAVIGPNGAGKTTIFNLISGVIPADHGEIRFNDERISGLKPYQIAEKGVVRTFQSVSLFDSMTVLDNVKVGCHTGYRSGMVAAALRTSLFRKDERAITQQAMQSLRMLGVEHRAADIAGNLPFGQQRLVDIARALASNPKILMLDEPAAGLNPQETAELGSILMSLKQSGLTILLIEHDMDLVMTIADRILALEYGVKIAEGTRSEIQNHQTVIRAYLGEDE